MYSRNRNRKTIKHTTQKHKNIVAQNHLKYNIIYIIIEIRKHNNKKTQNNGNFQALNMVIQKRIDKDIQKYKNRNIGIQ